MHKLNTLLLLAIHKTFCFTTKYLNFPFANVNVNNVTKNLRCINLQHFWGDKCLAQGEAWLWFVMWLFSEVNIHFNSNAPTSEKQLTDVKEQTCDGYGLTDLT